MLTHYHSLRMKHPSFKHFYNTPSSRTEQTSQNPNILSLRNHAQTRSWAATGKRRLSIISTNQHHVTKRRVSPDPRVQCRHRFSPFPAGDQQAPTSRSTSTKKSILPVGFFQFSAVVDSRMRSPRHNLKPRYPRHL